jgi:superfamily II DNA or RNA helicase
VQIPPDDERDAGQNSPGSVGVGDTVRVRQQRWRVVDVRPFEACRLITLSGAGASGAPSTRRVLTPFERIDRLTPRTRPRVVRASRWREAGRALLAARGPATRLRAATNARIDLLAHQLEPAIAVVAGLGTRLLIADEVGLGKTIEAALVVAELLARGAADRVLVLTPVGLRDEWVGELRSRFGLDAAVADARELRLRAAELPVGHNPWSTPPLVVASLDFVKRPEVLPAVAACRWDVVVVDEAHTAGPRSDRAEATDRLCGRAPYVVLLTATPHSGDHAAFEALCRMGRRGDGPVLMFRRTRRELAAASTTRVHSLAVRPTEAELRMHELLESLVRTAGKAPGTDARDVRLALAMLCKRAFSSPRSLERSVGRRLAGLDDPSEGRACQPSLPLDDDQDPSDDAPAWTVGLLESECMERSLLARLGAQANAAARGESKIAALVRLLRRLRALGEPAIVFTEYRDTLMHLARSLPFPGTLLHGGLSRDERRDALADFTSGRCGLLLATDAAGEGLNLHHHCRVVINLELPWNPARLEQRSGRVDRIGQARTVHVFHLIAARTGETRVLARLLARVAAARTTLDVRDPLGVVPARLVEEAVIELVIGSAARGQSPPSTEPPMPSPQLSGGHGGLARWPALGRRAAAERQRLVDVRTLGGGTTALLESAVALPMIARSRRRATRIALGRCLLALLRTSLEDGLGRPVATEIVAVRLTIDRHPHAPPRRLRELWPLVRAALDGRTGDIRARVDRTIHGWAVRAARDTRRFWRARSAREVAISTAASGERAGMFQPGLFDRRAASARSATEQQLAEAVSLAAFHAARASAAARTRVGAAEIVLALVV